MTNGKMAAIASIFYQKRSLKVSNTKPPHPRRYIKADILTQVSEN
jgi:hypothetical protein